MTTGWPEKGRFRIPEGKTRRERFYPTREAWVEAWAEAGFNPKPPTYWMERKRQEDFGLTDKALGFIWFRNYNLGRKAGIWLEAPVDDLVAAGYLVIS